MESCKEAMLHDGCGAPDQGIKRVLVVNRSTFSAGTILLVAVES